jgi:hypothetical protein
MYTVKYARRLNAKRSGRFSFLSCWACERASFSGWRLPIDFQKSVRRSLDPAKWWNLHLHERWKSRSLNFPDHTRVWEQFPVADCDSCYCEARWICQYIKTKISIYIEKNICATRNDTQRRILIFKIILFNGQRIWHSFLYIIEFFTNFCFTIVFFKYIEHLQDLWDLKNNFCLLCVSQIFWKDLQKCLNAWNASKDQRSCSPTLYEILP